MKQKLSIDDITDFVFGTGNYGMLNGFNDWLNKVCNKDEINAVENLSINDKALLIFSYFMFIDEKKRKPKNISELYDKAYELRKQYEEEKK